MSNNPFEVSSADPQAHQQQLPDGVRPPSATVFGILNLVFGIIGICGIIFTVIGLIAVNVPEIAKNMGDDPGFQSIQSPTQQTLLIFQSVLGFLLIIIQIASGIGLLKFVPWGRTLGIKWAIANLVLLVVGTVATLVLVTLPMMNQLEGPAGQMGFIGGVVGGIVGLIFGAIYPSLFLYFMTRPKFIAAIGG